MILDKTKIKDKNYLIEQIEQLKNKEILIYGAGSFGKEMCKFLEDYGVNIYGFIDKNAKHIKEYCNHRVYLLEDQILDKNSKCVLFTIVMNKNTRKEVLEEIYKAGYLDVREAQYYRSLQVEPSEDTEINRVDFYKKNKNNIERAYNLLCDEKSKKIFEVNLKAHFYKEFTECENLEDSMEQQYFPEDIKFAKGYSNFIDCGGFIGDTMEELFKKKSDVKAVVEFEPDLDNFNKLISQTKKWENKEIICFPCAVTNKTGFANFATASGSGTLSEKGNKTIMTISLDQVLPTFIPTMIKMDIEGAEYNAIKGAEEMIRKHAPDMAVCVYHHIDHLWKLLLQLNEYQPKYDFYLRNYNAFTMETVLYASQRSVS